MQTIRLASVALADASAASPTTWVEVTREGDYKGYPGGGFRFTPEVLGQIVRNFRAHPAYQLGPDGTGSADVIPWDFNHASEMPPTAGALPTHGAPAQAWVQDLDVRIGPGGAQLWAKTRWLEPARTYVKNGQYRWASVTVIFDARDPKTGANVGCLLTSIALTNTPFVEGMSELVAASRNAAGQMRVRWPSHLSRQTPAARTLMRSLANGAIRLVCDDGDDYHAGTEDDPADVERARLARAAAAPHRSGPPLEKRIDASGAAGRNSIEKVITAMRASVPDFARLSWEEQVERASEALRLGVASNETAAPTPPSVALGASGQVATGRRYHWPGHLSWRTPAARAMIASLEKAGVEVTSDDPAFRSAASATPSGPANNAPAPIDASGAPGRNPVEKAIAAMCSAVPGFERLTWDQKFERAVQAMKAGVVSA
jgi:Mu-like prophage I protein